MSDSILFMGEAGADADVGAKLFRFTDGVDDAGTQFSVYGRTQWLQPALGGGSCVFYDAYVTITWSMDATLRFKPLLDEFDDSMPFVTGTIEVIETDLVLTAGGDGQRQTATYRIPLVAALKDSNGLERTRNQLVGTRLRLEFNSVGTLGSGDLILDGAEVEYEEVQDDKPQVGQ